MSACPNPCPRFPGNRVLYRFYHYYKYYYFKTCRSVLCDIHVYTRSGLKHKNATGSRFIYIDTCTIIYCLLNYSRPKDDLVCKRETLHSSQPRCCLNIYSNYHPKLSWSPCLVSNCRVSTIPPN